MIFQHIALSISDFSSSVHQNIIFLGEIPKTSINDLTGKVKGVGRRSFTAKDMWSLEATWDTSTLINLRWFGIENYQIEAL